jgi:cell division septation protein DedD
MSTKPIYLLLIFSVFCPPSVFSQTEKPNWKKSQNLAEKAVATGDLEDAATHFETAFRLRPQKLSFADKAGQAYLLSRDYRRAAELLAFVVNDKKYAASRLLYAQALQQKGEYDAATPEFLLYLNQYAGEDRERVAEQIEDFVKGCTQGIRQADSVATLSKILVEHLNESINSPDNDIAPVPFGDEVLYFTNLAKTGAKILRTHYAQGEWSAAEPLSALPIPQSTPFGNGTFSPDGQRFYCTICQDVVKKREKTRSCSIYVLKRQKEGAWSAATRLTERVNTEGGMTTHPFVFFKGNKEILLFSSNRLNGRGGMDIWLTSRFRTDEQSDFDLPMNLGSVINTEGDEVTPFYDDESQMLYFASNGRATLGGLDIFKSNGYATRWTSPLNMGMPYNSGADDWYFVQNKSKTGGFFVSNRLFGMEKLSSRDDDIFQFTLNNNPQFAVSGRVFEKESKTLLENARVSLYERRSIGGELRLLTSVMCSEGQYQLPTLADRLYTLEVEKDGFHIGTLDFSTKDSAKNRVHDFYLNAYAVLAVAKITDTDSVNNLKKDSQTVKKQSLVNEKPKKPKNTDAKNTATVQKPPLAGEEEKKTTTPEKKETVKPQSKPSHVRYKIQVLAYENAISAAHVKKLARVENLGGEFETESAKVNGKDFSRILLCFDTQDSAKIALQKIKKQGGLEDAFILRYVDGKRQ